MRSLRPSVPGGHCCRSWCIIFHRDRHQILSGSGWTFSFSEKHFETNHSWKKNPERKQRCEEINLQPPFVSGSWVKWISEGCVQPECISLQLCLQLSGERKVVFDDALMTPSRGEAVQNWASRAVLNFKVIFWVHRFSTLCHTHTHTQVYMSECLVFTCRSSSASLQSSLQTTLDFSAAISCLVGCKMKAWAERGAGEMPWH